MKPPKNYVAFALVKRQGDRDSIVLLVELLSINVQYFYIINVHEHRKKQTWSMQGHSMSLIYAHELPNPLEGESGLQFYDRISYFHFKGGDLFWYELGFYRSKKMKGIGEKDLSKIWSNHELIVQSIKYKLGTLALWSLSNFLYIKKKSHRFISLKKMFIHTGTCTCIPDKIIAHIFLQNPCMKHIYMYSFINY